MPREDWTPAVLATAVLSVVTATAVWIFGPGAGVGGQPEDTPARRLAPAEVVVWAGEVAPGLKGVLTPVWGDPVPDDEHDRLLNEDLGLEKDHGFAWFRLLLFNLSQEPRRALLSDGALALRAPGSSGRSALVNLAALARRGEVRIAPSLDLVLRSQGGLRSEVDLPAGRWASLLLPFEGSLRLDAASEVVTAEGRALVRRPMARAVYRRLLEAPDEESVRDL